MTKLANTGRCFRCSRDRDLDLDLERVLDLGMDQSLRCRSEVRIPNGRGEVECGEREDADAVWWLDVGC